MWNRYITFFKNSLRGLPSWVIGLAILLPFALILLLVFVIFRNLLSGGIDSKYLTKQAFRETTFEPALLKLCKAWRIRPNDLLKLLTIESNLDPSAINPSSGASGLFQLMPSSAQALNIDLFAFRMFSATAQIKVLERYWRQLGFKEGDFRNVYDLYLSIFFPAAVGKDDNYTLEAKNLSASKVATANPLFDLNKDKIIQRYEVKKYVDSVA